MAETARVATVTVPPASFDAAQAFEANRGGGGTVRRSSDADAFSLLQANLSFTAQADFAVGNGLFERIRVTPPASTIASDGLGPMKNLRACQDCHIKDARGHPPARPEDDAGSLVVRLSQPVDIDTATSKIEACLGSGPDPVYGHRFSDRSVPGVPAEGRVQVV